VRVEEIFEGISNVLFHGTSIEAAASILKRNEFRLIPELATGEFKMNGRRNSEYVYFMSTARTKQSDFTSKTEVIFRLDGRKLSANYTGSPVSFFGDKSAMDESEDRIYSMNPTIKRASQYITAVEMYSMFGSFDDTESFIIQTSMKMGIPVRVYDSKEDMASNQRPWSEEKVISSLEGEPRIPDRGMNKDAEEVGDLVVRLFKGRFFDDSENKLKKALRYNEFDNLINELLRKGSDNTRHEIMREMRLNKIQSISGLRKWVHDEMRKRGEM